jgi:hypothetical protein
MSGYYTMGTKEERGFEAVIDPRLPLDFINDPLQQWPYAFAEAVMENEVEETHATIKTAMVIKAVSAFSDPGEPLNRFTCPKIDDEWEMDPDDFYDFHDEFAGLI